ncbi:MAG: FAD-dependent monooxygenase [Myxococcota bacterium]|nr:FAD-binding protein [Myxococcales bacterium]MEC7750344.1 FAD-dependent monooxygenase [Myxococcota bacterium]
MPSEHEIRLPLEHPLGRASGDELNSLLSAELGRAGLPILLRRSLDTRRRRRPSWLLKVALFARGEQPTPRWQPTNRQAEGPSVVIVGAGPAGSFAALSLLEAGFSPIIIDRGQPVRPRRRSLKALSVDGDLDPESNYCFGEGGAGTFSDGKLYTRSKDRQGVRRLLEMLVAYGAPSRILYDSRPHIGSNQLPRVLTALRTDLEARGVRYEWGARVTEVLQGSDERVSGVGLLDGRFVEGSAVILATGHSARDIYSICQRQGIKMTAKGFALGLRAEHPQAMVDEAQYGARCLDLDLPPAFYQLTAQTTMHGVYSFCMCPGGYIVPASTEPDRLVVNGMSLSRRDSPFANSGVVITVSEDDLAAWAYEQSRPGPSEDPLIGMTFQAHVEGEAYRAGGGQFRAPAQRIDDFVAGRKSQDLPATSYRRGIVPHGFDRIFPATILDSLRQALRRFDERLTGYLSHEGILVAPESRSSAPVRIQRHRESLESTSHPGLYPCGEGAGFAGGIMSAALDGQKVAAAVVRNLS